MHDSLSLLSSSPILNLDFKDTCLHLVLMPSFCYLEKNLLEILRDKCHWHNLYRYTLLNVPFSFVPKKITGFALTEVMPVDEASFGESLQKQGFADCPRDLL